MDCRGPLTILDILDRRGGAAKNCFSHIRSDGVVARSLTYAALQHEALAIARMLQERGLRGQRVMMIYPPGLEFISAFFGALYAGAIAVPCHPPKPIRRSWERLEAIAQDCGVAAVLTTTALAAQIARWRADLPGFDGASIVTTDDVDADTAPGAEAPFAPTDSVAFIQYTSGSTGTPKGVMVSHANIMANALATAEGFSIDEGSVIVCWLPAFHDLGLLGNVIQTVYAGASCMIMAPASVVQRPAAWLETISNHRASHAMGPNFIYELCRKRVTGVERSRLDLSAWKVALNAAEPIRAETIERFARDFAVSGFRPEAFRTAYGLAEATLVVTASDSVATPRIIELDADALETQRVARPAPAGRGRRLVSSGRPRGDQQVLIVDPDTGLPCGDDRAGEIWVRGANVAAGYWGNDKASAATFAARTAGGGPYLRTGDLGLLRDGELYVTGRIKELIIVRGRNFYPQDIEFAAQEADPAFRRAGGAAFAVDGEDGEDLVLVQELERDRAVPDYERLARSARAAIVEAFDLDPAAILFVSPQSVPKTSSGKIQRAHCRELFRAGGLTVLHHARRPTAPPPTPPGERAAAALDWLRAYLGRHLPSPLMDARRAMSPQLVLDLGNHGMMGLEAPVAAGGLGLTVRDAVRAIEVAGAFDLTVANFLILQNTLGLRPVLRHGTAELRERYLAPIASGRVLAAFALTEPEAGSNPRALRTVARPAERGGWLIDGAKIWIGNAGWAGLIHVFARQIDEAGNHVGLSAYALPAETAGLRIGDEHQTMGLRAMPQNSVTLEQAQVAAGQQLGAAGAGMAVAQDAMAHARLYIAAGALGAMKRAAELMVRYAADRAVGAGALGRLGETRRRLARIRTETRALERLIDAACAALDGDRTLPDEIYAMCKILAPEMLWHAVDDAMQLLGGRGYIETNFLPQMMRDARILRVFEGPTETLLAHLGALVRERPATLAGFLKGDLGGAEAARLLPVLLRGLEERRFGDPNDRNLAFGQVAAAAAVAAALERDADEGSAWARDELDRIHRAALRMAAVKLPTFEQLRNEIEAGQSLLGRLAHAPARESWQIDARLEGRLPDPMPAQGGGAVVAERAQRGTVPANDTVRGAIRNWLDHRLASIPADPTVTFAEMGLDSIGAVELAVHLEAALALEIDSTVLWVHTTIDDLAGFLTRRLTEREGGDRPSERTADIGDADRPLTNTGVW